MSLFSLFRKKEEPKQSPYLNKYISNSITKPKTNWSSTALSTNDIKSKLGLTSGANKTKTVPAPTISVQKQQPPAQQTQQSSVPSYISGYETLAEQKKKLLGEQKTSGEDYLNRYYGAKSQANQANIDALQKNLAANKASYAKALEGQQALTETKKQNVEDVWGTTQRQSAQTRAESEARNRNKFAALGTTSSYGAGSYGQAQENVESDFNRLTQENLRAKASDLQDLDVALQEYELESQAKLDNLDLEVTQAINSIIADQTTSEIEKENAIKELGFAYQEAVLGVQDELQGYYKDYYNALASAEEGLSFDENGQPLNQKSYEWMLTNPDEYNAAFQSDTGESASKVRGIIEQLSGINTKGITGRVRNAWSDEARSAAGLVKQLSSELQIEEAKRLKGQGSMSDSERSILANSISAMNPDENGYPQVSDTRFREILNEMYMKFGGSNLASTNINSLADQF